MEAPSETSALPMGTVTFLLTDVEGSTRLWEKHAETMSIALVRHDAIVDEVVRRFGGFRIKARSEGDSSFSVFDDAGEAIASALAMQRLLASETWPTPVPIRVRAAVHTGEAQLQAGEYVGSAVTRAARLRTICHGGQIIISQDTHDLVRDGLPEGSALKDLGTHRLKDLSIPERIYQLIHPDLADSFPPLKSLDARPNNLPIQLATFIGREREISELKDRVMSKSLVTITGPSGAGKSRLALQLGAELLDELRDGVWLIDFSSITDPEMVPQAVASTVGIRGAPVVPTEDVGERRRHHLQRKLIDHLRHRSLALIFDDCDELTQACAALAETLGRVCSGARIVATSREPLRATGETVWVTPPLTHAAPDIPCSADDLLGFESSRLFIDRAKLARPEFEMTEREAPAVARICAILRGNPGHIELAAAWVKALTCEQIADRLAKDPSRLLRRKYGNS